MIKIMARQHNAKPMHDDDFRKDLTDYVRRVIKSIDDSDRADEESEDPSLTLTVSTNGKSWGAQTGDNSFTGGAYGYPHWAVVYLTPDSDAKKVVKEIYDQWDELMEDDDSSDDLQSNPDSSNVYHAAIAARLANP